MIQPTTENGRSNPEISVEDTGNHRFHKTICSIQDELDIAVAIRQEVQPRHSERYRRPARRWESVFLLQAHDTCARTYHERLVARARRESILEIRISAKNRLCRKTPALRRQWQHAWRTS